VDDEGACGHEITVEKRAKGGKFEFIAFSKYPIFDFSPVFASQNMDLGIIKSEENVKIVEIAGESPMAPLRTGVQYLFL